MLRLNRKTDYAVRVLLALAKRGAEARVATATIQQEMLIPPALSLQVVAELAKGGFILTYPGREGGIQLARPAHLINLLQVVEYFEGPIRLSECIGGKVVCPFESACPVRKRWIELSKTIRMELAQITFADLDSEAVAVLPMAITLPE